MAADESAEVPIAAQHPECFYKQFEKIKSEGLTCRANNFNIRHSVYKLAIAARMVKGMHLYDA